MPVVEDIQSIIDRVLEKLAGISVIGLLGILPYVVIFSFALPAFLVVAVQRFLQEDSASGPLFIKLAAVAVLCAAAFKFTQGVWAKKIPDLHENQATFVKSFLFSFMLGCPALVIVCYLGVWKFPEHYIHWRRYGYLDKRWLLALYLLAVFFLLAIPAVFNRLLISRRNDGLQPKDSGLTNGLSNPHLTGRYGKTKAVVLALLVATFLFGPPWNIQRSSTVINAHEEVHLGPLQAIHKGYLPNIGPAAQQYGPGSQLFHYTYMKLTDQFSLAGFRKAQGLLHYLAFTGLCCIAFMVLGYKMAGIAIVLALLISPFKLTTWTGNGGLYVWGWPNPIRYLGALVLVVGLPGLLIHKRNIKVVAVAVGAFWGGMCWMSPENLLAGVVASGLLISFLWALRVTSLNKIVPVIALIVAGFFLFWIPLAAFYLSKGSLGAYMSNYTLIGGQVLRGFSNSKMHVNITSNPVASNIIHYAIPVTFLVVLRLLYSDFKLQIPTWRHIAVLSLSSFFIASFFPALTRVDSAHLYNVLIGFPLLLVAFLQHVPLLITRNSMDRNVCRVAIIALIGMFSFNSAASRHTLYNSFRNTMNKYRTVARETNNRAALGGSVARKRFGFEELSEGALFKSKPPTRAIDLIEEMDYLHHLFRGQNVYVHSFNTAEPGMVYFLADLHQPPLALEPALMIFSSEIKKEFDTYFETMVGQVDNLVTMKMDVEEARIFMEHYDDAKVLKRKFGGKDYYVLRSAKEL